MVYCNVVWKAVNGTFCKKFDEWTSLTELN